MGSHLLLEVYNVESSLLNDSKSLVKVITRGILRAGMTILNTFSHDFEPQGVTIVITLAESHFSLHSWPEHNCVSADIYTCGEKNPKIIALELLKHLNSDVYTLRQVYR